MKRGRHTDDAPDPFSVSAVRKVLAPLTNQMTPPEASETWHILPKDLEVAIKRLDDREFDRLVAAVNVEQKRRGRTKLAKAEIEEKPASRSLSVGKMNAIRAAFQAGVTPSRIARQFGVSQAHVRLVLSSNKAK